MRFRLFGRVYTLSKKIYVLIILLILALVATVGHFLLKKSQQEDLSLVLQDTPSVTPTRSVLPVEHSTPPTMLAVHISGEVECPGVYWVIIGAIVDDVVEMAGGLTDDANTQVINLALRVEDGMHIHIPNKNSQETHWLQNIGASPGMATPGKVNLNTATLEELMSLNGVGESTAKDIIQYRTEHGSFNTIEDIMNVPGIKQARFEKIKNQITV